MESKVTIKIPRTLYNRLRVIIEDTGFNSVTDFIVYVLRDIVASKGAEEREDILTRAEIEQIKEKLRKLGYL